MSNFQCQDCGKDAEFRCTFGCYLCEDCYTNALIDETDEDFDNGTYDD